MIKTMNVIFQLVLALTLAALAMADEGVVCKATIEDVYQKDDTGLVKVQVRYELDGKLFRISNREYGQASEDSVEIQNQIEADINESCEAFIASTESIKISVDKLANDAVEKKKNISKAMKDLNKMKAKQVEVTK